MNKHLSEDENKIILSLYEEGKNTVKIGKILHRSDNTIGRYLKSQGKINYGIKSDLSYIDIENIKKIYLEGMTSKQIYEIYNNKIGCEETIQNIIRKNGISRSRGFKNEFNYSYFENIDTPTKAYFLGLMLTDGNVHIPKRMDRQKQIQIGLKLEDKYILEIFKRELAVNKKVTEYNKNNRSEAYLIVYSNKMADDLSKYGIIPNKTFLIDKIPSISAGLLPDLIRGIFDGDGTVYIKDDKYRPLRFGFYGTHNLLCDIVDKLKILNLSKNKIFDKETVSFITFGRREDIKAFYDYIYYSNEIVYLKRKKDKFDENLKSK